MEKNDRKEIIIAYQHVFAGPLGEVVLNDLLNTCGVKRTSFSQDNGVMAFNEGMRNIGLHIQAMLESKPVDKQAKVKVTDPI